METSYTSQGMVRYVQYFCIILINLEKLSTRIRVIEIEINFEIVFDAVQMIIQKGQKRLSGFDKYICIVISAKVSINFALNLFCSCRLDIHDIIKQIRGLFNDRIELNHYLDVLLPKDLRINHDLAKKLSQKLKVLLALTNIKHLYRSAPQVNTVLQKFKQGKINSRAVCDQIKELTTDEDILFGVIYYMRDRTLTEYQGYMKLSDSFQNRNVRFFYDDAPYKEIKQAILMAGEQQKAYARNEIVFFYKLKSTMDQMTRFEQISLGFDQKSMPMGYFQEFAGVLKLYNLGIISMQDLFELLQDNLKQFDPVIRQHLKLMLTSREISRRNLVCKPISELNYAAQNNAQRVTPSYLLISDEFPISICSSKTKFYKRVLNQRYVSIPSGSEHFSFKHMRKNVFEDALFKAEDQQFQIDMQIGNLQQTKQYLKSLYVYYKKKILHHPNDQIPVKSFDSQRLKTIKKIYGAEIKKVLQMMYFNPTQVCKVMIDRLRLVIGELREKKQEKFKQWRDSYEKNFLKSLDHRSFYFKQNQKKNVNHKNFVNQLRERKKLVENNSKVLLNIKLGGSGEIDFFQSFCFNELPPSVLIKKSIPEKQTQRLMTQMDQNPTFEVPQYRFLWNDITILQMAFSIIKQSLQSFLSGQQLRKAFFWISTVENDFLGLPDSNTYSIFNPDTQDKNIDQRIKLPVSNVSSFIYEYLTMKLQKSNLQHQDVIQVEYQYSQQYQQQREQRQQSSSVYNLTFNLDDNDQSIDLINLPQCKKVPKFRQMRDNKSQNQKLFYGSTLFFSILRFIYTIYDRLLVAKDLVSRRIDQIMTDQIYIQKKYEEYFQKDEIAFIKDQILSRFLIGMQMFIKSNLAIEVSKYQEFCRNLLGSQAYLLFGVEKLMNNTIKSIQSLLSSKTQTDLWDIYHDSQSLVKNFTRYQDIYFSLATPYLVYLDQEDPVRFLHNRKEMILSISLIGGQSLGDKPRITGEVNQKLNKLVRGQKYSTFSIKQNRFMIFKGSSSSNEKELESRKNCVEFNNLVQKVGGRYTFRFQSQVVSGDMNVRFQANAGNYFYRLGRNEQKPTEQQDFAQNIQISSDFRSKINEIIQNI